MRSENKNDLEVLIRKYTASDSVNTMLADIKYILNRRLLDRENRYTHFGVKDEFLAGQIEADKKIIGALDDALDTLDYYG
jgi:hypothetical protein